MNIRNTIREELADLVRFRATSRPWYMPCMAAIGSGLPVLIGAMLGNVVAGLTASLGSFVFLYLPQGRLSHRMAMLLGCAFGISCCYAIGLATSHWRPAAIPVVGVIATIVSMAARQYGVPRPMGLFFIMVTCIGAYSETSWQSLPFQVGLVVLGAFLACALGFVYSLINRDLPAEPPAQMTPAEHFQAVVFDPVIIGIALAAALATAQLLGIEKPYWAPIACLSIIQGVSLRAVWSRPFHRTFGTCVGLVVALGLFSLPLQGWGLALTVMALTFCIESAIVRNYGFASIFTTPLAIILAESARIGTQAPLHLMEARFYDTIVGCVIGILFGNIIHHPGCRAWLSSRLPDWRKRPFSQDGT